VKIETSAIQRKPISPRGTVIQKTNRRASKKDLAVNMIAGDAAAMDADLAALLNVLEVPGVSAAAPVLETVEQPALAASTEVLTEVIESANVDRHVRLLIRARDGAVMRGTRQAAPRPWVRRAPGV
jgi:tRNA threonylcarbamoyladenosine modification (KEOPS) complex  Pcc1 subunit